jgi:hypothetical protein
LRTSENSCSSAASGRNALFLPFLLIVADDGGTDGANIRKKLGKLAQFPRPGYLRQQSVPAVSAITGKKQAH